MEWDFTVLPYILLLLKFFDLGMWSNRQYDNFNWWVTFGYIVLFIYCWLLAPLLRYIINKTITTRK